MNAATTNSPIAEGTRRCLQSFDALSNARFDPFRSGIQDNITRCRIWAGNLGAFHGASSRRSADHRLRDAPEVTTRILELLEEIVESNSELSLLLSQFDTGSDADVDDEEKAEIDDLVLSVGDNITSLLKASALLRRATARDRYAKAALDNSNPLPVEYSWYDERHVLEKFPKSKHRPWLVKRLAEAITRRRKFLRYAQNHRDKVARISTDAAPSQTALLDQESHVQDYRANGSHSAPLTLTPSAATTSASTLQVEKLVRLSVQGAGLDEDDNISLATSFASLGSRSGDPSRAEVIRLDDLTKDRAPFECPYCCGMVQFGDQREWRKHVFRDLRAYVCTFEGCDTGLFEGRSSWFHHELEYHRRVWVCLNCPGRNFADADSFGRHLKKWHSSEQLAILPHTLNANSRPATEVPADACPLCDEWYESMTSNVDGEHESAQQQLVVSLNDFRQHLGSHQEQLALFAVALNVEFGKRGQSHDGSDGAEGGEDIKRMDLLQWQIDVHPESDAHTPSPAASITKSGSLPASPEVAMIPPRPFIPATAGLRRLLDPSAPPRTFRKLGDPRIHFIIHPGGGEVTFYDQYPSGKVRKLSYIPAHHSEQQFTCDTEDIELVFLPDGTASYSDATTAKAAFFNARDFGWYEKDSQQLTSIAEGPPSDDETQNGPTTIAEEFTSNIAPFPGHSQQEEEASKRREIDALGGKITVVMNLSQLTLRNLSGRKEARAGNIIGEETVKRTVKDLKSLEALLKSGHFTEMISTDVRTDILTLLDGYQDCLQALQDQLAPVTGLAHVSKTLRRYWSSGELNDTLVKMERLRSTQSMLLQTALLQATNQTASRLKKIEDHRLQEFNNGEVQTELRRNEQMTSKSDISTPKFEQPQPSLPSVLQDYYDKKANVELHKQRLLNLYVEFSDKKDNLVARKGIGAMVDSSGDENETTYRRHRNEEQVNLSRAEFEAEKARFACLNAGVAIPSSPDTEDEEEKDRKRASLDELNKDAGMKDPASGNAERVNPERKEPGIESESEGSESEDVETEEPRRGELVASSLTTDVSDTGQSPYQDQLVSLCRTSGVPSPTWQVVSDRRGGRTAWSSTVTVQGQHFPARFWYDGQYIHNAKEGLGLSITRDRASEAIYITPADPSAERTNPVNEVALPTKGATESNIPPRAQWTKIDRHLISRSVLEEAQEPFEERSDYVIVKRVLTREEIQVYADHTKEMEDKKSEAEAEIKTVLWSDHQETVLQDYRKKQAVVKLHKKLLKELDKKHADDAHDRAVQQWLDEKPEPSNVSDGVFEENYRHKRTVKIESLNRAESEAEAAKTACLNADMNLPESRETDDDEEEEEGEDDYGEAPHLSSLDRLSHQEDDITPELTNIAQEEMPPGPTNPTEEDAILVEDDAKYEIEVDPQGEETDLSDDTLPSSKEDAPKASARHGELPRLSQKSKDFFTVGRIFETWTLPPSTYTTDSKRWFPASIFVVLRTSEQSFTAVPVVTYDGQQGMAKDGGKKPDDNAILYSGERSGFEEEGMLPPIHMEPDSPELKLDAKSRINFAFVFNFKYDVEVLSVGMVSAPSMPRLLLEYGKYVLRRGPENLIDPASDRTAYGTSSQTLKTPTPATAGGSNYLPDDGSRGSVSPTARPTKVHKPSGGRRSSPTPEDYYDKVYK